MTTTALTNITYSCQEDTMVSLTCVSSTKLTIVDAFYGVPSCANCTCGYCTCASMNVTSNITAQCTGLTSCSFTAGNAVLGDPCVEHSKTFQLTYFCS
ncbi:unnamed protein product [Rotaria sordida]|uniref:SUEL-type lectin domain-containing protein n=1 Tax=Rotaria sordida TaxID=392033 RepID=A0A814EX27_9BILA|nr:unnamed protein product [Rotaria sordida]